MFLPNSSRTTLLLGFALLLTGCGSPGRLGKPLAPAANIRSAHFANATGSVLGATFTPGNRIETLNNGAEIFPAMLAGIRSARSTVNLETFVFYHGEVPQQFAEALAERARAGVRVKVILDAVGSKKSRRYHSMLRDAGVDLVVYRPLFSMDFQRYNHRTHRKLLIVDGKLGFIGGVGIADDWDGHARNPEEWRDLHYRVRGPVVAQLQAAFNDNWFLAKKELLQGPEYYPTLAPAGNARAGIFYSSPVRGRASVDFLYHLTIASARESLLIANAYFLPDKPLVDALCAAAQRGVKVKVIIPGEHMDQKAVARASRKRWPKLLAAGVQIYQFEPTMIHTKLLIADGSFVSVGSSNFDPRSLAINDEANMNVLDVAFAREQTRIFERDLRRSRPVEVDPTNPGRLKDLPQSMAEKPLESQL